MTPFPGEGRIVVVWVSCRKKEEFRVAAVPKGERLGSWTCKVLSFAAGTARSEAVPQKASCQRGGTQHFKTIYKYLTYFLWIAQ